MKVKPLEEGDLAPEVTLLTDTGETFRLSGLRGKKVVLYFYPKANTPGCTTEACEFRDTFPKFERGGAVIAGVSPDKAAAQASFRNKYDLTFPLLCDFEHRAAEAYGVWKEKSLYGRKFMGVERTTFVIGSDGRIRKIFRKVKPAGHAREVLEALDGK
jgi:peroxiredoxin Q/BCP